jgi:hypothetical protein
MKIYGGLSIENSYLKNVVGEFFLREGQYRSDISGLRDGRIEQKLSEILQEKDAEYSLVFEAGMGDCSQCVDSILNLLGKTTLDENLIFITTFKNQGSLRYIKAENNLNNAIFLNTIIERNSAWSLGLYLIDKQMKTTSHCLADYRNMPLVKAYLKTIENKYFKSTRSRMENTE